MFGLEQTLARVPPSWDRPSPCDGWTVRTCRPRHGGHHNIAARARGGEVIDAFTDVGTIAGDDPVARVSDASDQLPRGDGRRGALQTQVVSRLGDMNIDSHGLHAQRHVRAHVGHRPRAAIEPHFDPQSCR
jgi:hypothetical protein